MPLITTQVSTALDNNLKEVLKKEFGQIITTIPGKTEKSLMITFQDSMSIFLSGEEKNSAYLEVKLFGSAERKYKEILIEKLSTCITTYCNIPTDHIYITISELPEWGARGKLL
ncbi:macrophage migration inhibitory factor (MIF) [Natranaerovirga pectinivora]|uniref:Macrophage migration inhibitory factor (MIF) n=1 Tax=Natranaerovirga pectinivora TaxID=682400 RepID=A0A4R3MDI2_9FIRM|nr:phenylpyruvate tautomerase MIF-related protein [Natranaerovirga pectinivora]TCT11611.1 macrophage migration inhibitory factor (MIF) [Natranaerovirga pectinivora]